MNPLVPTLRLGTSLMFCTFFFWSAARADFDPLIDSPMYRIPDVPMPPVILVFPEGLKELWLRALERPEADLKCKAADAIIQAHKRGMKGLETTIAPLLAALDREDQHATARLAIARTLIALEARQSAPSLYRQAQSGSSDLRELVEPVLARWDYRPIRAVWLERLREPNSTQRSLLLAIRGLAAVREEKAVDKLRAMALADSTPDPIRLESARALASLRNEGLEKDAERLLADASPRGMAPRLIAASLLRRHSGPEAIRLLQRLMRDAEPAVAALAVARLLEIDPQLVDPAVEHLVASADANVRSLAVDALARRPSAKHIRLLADRLDDEHLDVRSKARRYLQKLAEEKKWRDPILAEGMRLLQTKQWRSLEQAALLLTQLDHKPAAGRFVELLAFDRIEVRISAAWGLRKLDVPETLPGVLIFVDSQARRISSKEGAPALTEHDDHALSQLGQFLGQRKYRQSDAVLRLFVPKRREWREARAAAIWALGLIHDGETIDDLAAALEARLKDANTMLPEWNQVRLMCAFTLGRMKAKKTLPSLRKYFTEGELSRDPVNNACGWAITQITGEPLRPGKPVRKVQRNWFLTPQP
jgi:HEAT repeat protein